MSTAGFLGARALKSRSGTGISAPARPRLSVVPPRPEAAPIARFLVAVFVVLALGLLGLLFLNTVLAQDAYRTHDLKRTGLVLGDQEQALLRQVDALNDAAALAARARALGMVPGNDPRFLLAGGRLLGAAQPSGQPNPTAALANADGLVVVGTPSPVAPTPAGSAAPGAGGTAGATGASSAQPKASAPSSKPGAKPGAKPSAGPTPKPAPKPTPRPSPHPTSGR